MSGLGSVQTLHLRIDSIEEGVVSLPGGAHLAVLEVEATTFALSGEREREAIISAFATFLNSLAYKVQIVIRVVPLDLRRHLDDLERRVREELPEELRALAVDHALFLRRLASRRTLLERHFYVVVRAEIEARLGRGSIQSRLLGRFWPREPLDREPEVGDSAPIREREGALRQLTYRSEETLGGLERCGLRARRLGDAELAQLLYACWCPELSRIQRLERDLSEYTALAIGAARASRTATPSNAAKAADGASKGRPLPTGAPPRGASIEGSARERLFGRGG